MGPAFTGEALACLEALKMGLVLRLTKVIIEGDSLSVITKCNSSHTDKSKVSSHLRNIEGTLARFQSIIFMHVKRSGNALADALGTECVRKGKGFYLIGSVPDSAATTFSNDWLREPD